MFLTTYQNRSAKRNIDHLLEKWDLEGRVIDWEDFSFDMSKFVIDGDDEKEGGTQMNMNKRRKTETQQDGTMMDTPMTGDIKCWFKRARMEVTDSVTVENPIIRHKVPLVDYSSGSESEEEVGICEEEDSGKEQGPDVEPATGRSKYQMGDGGALSSVYLLWISKRGHGKWSEI